ncbi:hypothetical protein P152DRAFT_46997 [Eremomyces bilateralis CBS 781.70]|uniref:Uncharacterized protein n=1 Tax=Eremomyces bilateralis CBS 781.70 TaxID=1392243 RepID=A0A6G1G1Z2_9PEZI|nr:uncharacterized protein P152DRAFT_46997 [Eremomyces bilateralis CBS 781.70]KAF1812127.1 hypothetical protein P152DRAFT_46997 [Eremomyces bilateralis CBS 781.70]
MVGLGLHSGLAVLVRVLGAKCSLSRLGSSKSTGYFMTCGGDRISKASCQASGGRGLGYNTGASDNMKPGIVNNTGRNELISCLAFR